MWFITKSWRFRLYMRWNLIKKIENLDTLGESLEELEFYDNQITKIENLGALVNLKWVKENIFGQIYHEIRLSDCST